VDVLTTTKTQQKNATKLKKKHKNMFFNSYEKQKT